MKYCMLVLAGMILGCRVKAEKSGFLMGDDLFLHEVTWTQVLQKAKKEHRFIFVDCFATWCQPCKKMDAEVYPAPEVTDYLAGHFISIKVQMDSTVHDNAAVKAWYDQAASFARMFKIHALPSFLFFSSDGVIVHKAQGYQNKAAFMELLSDAMKPEKQSYTLLEKYRKGEKDYAAMEPLIAATALLGEEEWARKIASDYIEHYLVRLTSSELYSRKNIDLMSRYASFRNKRSFELFYKHSAYVDSVVRRLGFSNSVVDWVITSELIEPRIKEAEGTPDWEGITREIARKYPGKYGERTVLSAKIEWLKSRKEWEKLTDVRISYWERYGIDTIGFISCTGINNICWDEFFLHSTDPEKLKKVIGYMESVIRHFPVNEQKPATSAVNFVDTYANLLYKCGRVEEAIAWEEKAATWLPADKGIVANLTKMKKAEPTW